MVQCRIEHCKGDKYDFRFFQVDPSSTLIIAHWDVSHVVAFDNMFDAAVTFNQKISGWVTSKCAFMNAMFRKSESFNHDILMGILLSFRYAQYV